MSRDKTGAKPLSLCPMENLETIQSQLSQAFSDAYITLVPNPILGAQSSLLIDPVHAVKIATYLKTTPGLQFDYCSNVTGVDWLAKDITEPIPAGSAPGTVANLKRLHEGYLEAVYHLYSMQLGHGPLVLRLRTKNRTTDTTLPSLTPVWRSAEFQEREIYDLFGITFEGHPDLRRLLMWDEYKDFPMRKDYSEPDDYEWEPTAHGSILTKAQAHQKIPTQTTEVIV